MTISRNICFLLGALVLYLIFIFFFTAPSGQEKVVDVVQQVMQAKTPLELDTAAANAEILQDEQASLARASGMIAEVAKKKAGNYLVLDGTNYEGANINCGQHKTLKSIQAACTADNECLGFSMRSNTPMCLKKTLNVLKNTPAVDFHKKIPSVPSLIGNVTEPFEFPRGTSQCCSYGNNYIESFDFSPGTSQCCSH